jgi:hypothetical protein
VTPTHWPSLRRRWTWTALVVLVAVGGYLGWRHLDDGKTPAAPPPLAIPVTVSTIERADFAVYLNGLGTVEPYETVTVSSRVDGEISSQGGPSGADMRGLHHVTGIGEHVSPLREAARWAQRVPISTMRRVGRLATEHGDPPRFNGRCLQVAGCNFCRRSHYPGTRTGGIFH